MNTIRRTLHPETRVLDAKTGLVEYIASDETIDSYREVIRADGWRFNHFQKNAPFVDSHEYGTVEKLLGKVMDFKVVGKQLVETVKWAVDVAENSLAQLGWKMTEAGYLKAVSVGFWPTKTITANSGGKSFAAALQDLGLPADAPVRAIYTEQEQIELSAVVIGANPNALAKSYKAGLLTDADLEQLSNEYAKRFRPAAVEDALAAEHTARQRQAFVEKIQTIIKHT
jgi:hypothetical protein